ncbi:uncharacterized protein LOC135122877 [Zophobas morio]|uniref:uncharacterized protein LOC135122877 n=1 Tax=Zophobas morio TaxID=2755281 RepID=UPI0030835438
MKHLIVIVCFFSQFIIALSANDDFYGEEDYDLEYDYFLERNSREQPRKSNVTRLCYDKSTDKIITCWETREKHFVDKRRGEIPPIPSIVTNYVCLGCKDQTNMDTMKKPIFIFRSIGNGCFHQEKYNQMVGCSICGGEGIIMD